MQSFKYKIIQHLNQDNQTILCIVHAHIGIKEEDKTAKQVIYIPEMTTRLPYTNYYLTIKS